MGLKITRGTIASPAKAVLHGVEGIGKTTWCAKAPRPLFLDTEKGTKQLAVDRVDCRSWSDLEGAVLSLGRDREGYETVVIDSIDWAEQLAADALCKEEGKKSIEEFGFGKGYVILADRIRRLLHHLDGLVDRGMNVILIAHTKVARVSPPDQTDGYDRYELRTTKQVSPLIREWPDLLLFANYRVSIKEGTDGRAKAIGGRERVMYANRSAAWDAKNRHGLPDVLPFEFARVAHLFATTKIAATAPVAAADEDESDHAAGAVPEAPPVTAADSAPAGSDQQELVDEIGRYIAGAKNVRTLGKIVTRLDELLSTGQITDQQWSDLTDLADARHDEIEPRKAVPDA